MRFWNQAEVELWSAVYVAKLSGQYEPNVAADAAVERLRQRYPSSIEPAWPHYNEEGQPAHEGQIGAEK